MPRLKLKIQRPWIPYIIFIVTLTLTLLATAYTNQQTYTEDRLRFLNAVQDTNTNIRTQIETYIALLRGTAGLFAAEPNLGKQEFSDYASRLRLNQNYAGAMGLGFVQRIKNSDKNTYIQNVQQQDNIPFTITPVGERSEYYVVRYLIRTDKKTPTSIGMDIFTDRNLRSAMEKARDNGVSIASGKETVMDKDNNKKITVFVIFTPIYQEGNEPSSVNTRRNNLVGFVFMPFRVDTLLSEIVSNKILPQLVNYQIYDSENLTKQYMLYNSSIYHDNKVSFFLPRFREKRQFTVGGNTWTILYTNNPQFDSESAKNFSTIIFVGGILVCIMFFMLSRSQYIARTKAEVAALKLQASQKRVAKSYKSS